MSSSFGEPDSAERENSIHLTPSPVPSNAGKPSSNLRGSFSQYLERPSSLPRFRRLSDQESVLSASSNRPERERASSNLLRPRSNGASCSPTAVKTSKGSWHAFWLRQKGVTLVLLSQFFGALMNVTTRLLEIEREGLHPLQVCHSLYGAQGCFVVWLLTLLVVYRFSLLE